MPYSWRVISNLPRVARELGADERTLRRSVEAGLVRCRRPSPRTLDLPLRERAYLATHWRLLAALRRVLGTEPKVRMAVLYGSVARGDDGPESDVDLLVQISGDSPRAALALALRLGGKLDREVDIARLSDVEPSSPLLLSTALEEGRVLVDRDRLWHDLRSRRREIARRADKAFEEELADTRAAIAELRGSR
jgi:predicted nucleotidyltransferase